MKISSNKELWFLVSGLYMSAAITVLALAAAMHFDAWVTPSISTFVIVLLSPLIAIQRVVALGGSAALPFLIVSVFGVSALFWGLKHRQTWIGKALMFFGFVLEIGIGFVISSAIV